MKLKSVGIIGAGTMGIGTVVDLVLHDMEVVLIDISSEILSKAEKEIINFVKAVPLLKKSLPRISGEEVARRVRFSLNLEDLAQCYFIIENATEDWEVKKSIYKRLNKVCSEDTIIGANTSCISITQIASQVLLPERVVGIHLMNPVFMKDTVEVIKGYHTSEETLNRVEDFLALLNKNAIIVNDYPGFVANRISHLFMNEAAYVVQDQVASPKQVDEIFKKCYGHKMGPLETADLIGLDTVVNSLRVLYESYQDTKFKCCPLLKKMVDAGQLGMKSGRGFYKYTK